MVNFTLIGCILGAFVLGWILVAISWAEWDDELGVVGSIFVVLSTFAMFGYMAVKFFQHFS